MQACMDMFGTMFVFNKIVDSDRLVMLKNISYLCWGP